MRNTARFALTIGAAALFAGCGGSQTQLPVGVPGAVPQTAAIAAHADRSGSWMLPEAKNRDLLYVSGRNEVFVNSFPSGQKVGLLTGTIGVPGGLCSDSSGNVFVIEQNAIQEYAHGGMSPIATLSYSGDGPRAACSWDPTTGNLAVVYGTLWLYVGAQGQPKTYTETPFSIWGCAYDRSGHLFVAGEPKSGGSLALAEFDTKKGSFRRITLDKNLLFPLAALGWDGTYLAITQIFEGRSEKIERVQVSGSSGKVVVTVRLRGARGWPTETGSWIEGSSFVTPITIHGRAKFVDVWSYPKGGDPTHVLPEKDFPTKSGLYAVTVSVAPRR